MTQIDSDSRLLDVSKNNNSIIAFTTAGVVTASVVGISSGVLFTESATAAPSPEVVATITTATDTIPVLSGLCMAVFAAGLAPWAARTALSWMSSIMKGAI